METAGGQGDEEPVTEPMTGAMPPPPMTQGWVPIGMAEGASTPRKPILLAVVATVLLFGAAITLGVILTSSSGDSRPHLVSTSGAAPASQSSGQGADTSSAASEAGTTSYTTSHYTATIPAGWAQEEDAVDKGSYVESKWRDPQHPSDSILIDVTPHSSQQSPSEMAAPVHASLLAQKGYSEISYGPGDLGSGTSWKWVFRISGTKRVDYFFGQCSDDFAVLGTSRPSHFSSLLSAFRSTASSVQSTCR